MIGVVDREERRCALRAVGHECEAADLWQCGANLMRGGESVAGGCRLVCGDPVSAVAVSTVPLVVNELGAASVVVGVRVSASGGECRVDLVAERG